MKGGHAGTRLRRSQSHRKSSSTPGRSKSCRVSVKVCGPFRRMKPFFFGPSAQPRFGLLHPPAGERARRAGVLLCYPGVQEYNISHWAFRKLAGLLARAGFPVLRFDWAGTGDSAGESSGGRVSTWLEDVALAAQELKDSAEVERVSVV